MSKDFISSSIPFFPIGIKPSRETLSEIAFQMQTEGFSQAIGKQNFHYCYAVGRGGFGRVWKVEYKRNKCIYALKEMQKLRVVMKRSIHSVMNERKLLEVIKNPFIVNMQFAFQDKDNLYLVLDYKKGGDLRYHLSRNRKISESCGKF